MHFKQKIVKTGEVYSRTPIGNVNYCEYSKRHKVDFSHVMSVGTSTLMPQASFLTLLASVCCV